MSNGAELKEWRIKNRRQLKSAPPGNPWVRVERMLALLEASAKTDAKDNGASFTILRVISTLNNCGKTPAVENRVYERLELFDAPPKGFPELDLSKAATGTIGVDANFQTQPKVIRLLSEQLHNIRAGHLALLLYGVCLYKDIFGKLHRTRWCLRYEPQVRQFTMYSGGHNDID